MPPRFEQLCDELRERLRSKPARALNLPGVELREAAVLVPIFERGAQPHVLFTRRPTTLRSHAGQISFPGGARDESDATPLHAALRELDEELGVPPQRVDVLGMLDESPTVTSYRIQPFVGVIPGDFEYRPNPAEIDQVIEVPLSHLVRPNASRTELWRHENAEHLVYFFDYGPHVIWGATARILVDLLDRAEGLPAFEALR